MFVEKEIISYLTALKQGDANALGKLYDATAKPLYALCYTYFRNKFDSEDALHDAYVTVKKEIAKFNGKKGFNWLYTITKNICLNILKKKQRSIYMDFDDEQTIRKLGADSSDSLHIKDESGIIALSQQTLNEEEFRILILHTVSDLKFKEIAFFLNGKESTVRWQYNNALKKVKKEYIRRGEFEK